jgi:acetyl esterase
MLVTTPKDLKPGETLPAIVEYYGGGWVMGSPEFAQLHTLLSHRVVAFLPQYRVAPDHKFPTAPNDAYDALRWVQEHGAAHHANLDQLMVAGTSAGGNMAAVVAQLARSDQTNAAPKVRAQLLWIPCVEFVLHTASFAKHVSTPIWNTHKQLEARRAYFESPEQYADPRASPLLAASHAGLPPAFIVRDAEDPFYDDALLYEQALRTAGVPVASAEFDTYHAGELIMLKMGGYKAEWARTKAALDSFFATHVLHRP